MNLSHPRAARVTRSGKVPKLRTGHPRARRGSPESIVEAKVDSATIKLPKFGGLYRLYVYVSDKSNGAATANVSIKVDGPERVVEARKAKLPLMVAGEPNENAPYAPSGFMGNTKAVSMDSEWQTNPHTGKNCVRVRYAENTGWAGVVWQNPPHDWGDQPGGFDLTGAKKLSFAVRGASGGEQIKFGFGVIGADKTFHDTAKVEQEITLTDKWTKHAFDVTGKNLSQVKTGFMWVVRADGQPIEFFLDDVVFE